MKVIKTTDGKFAIVEREQVTRNIAIWSPVDERRFDTEMEASIAMMKMRLGIKEQPKPVVPEKKVITIDRSHLPYRADLRITKLMKGLFVIEQRKNGEWVKCKTTKTLTKAEEWCAVNSR